jgi:ABC-type branched-subunit amino acid transport system substrate-binding protein
MRVRAAAAIFFVLALAASGCGARLTDAERAAGINALLHNNGGSSSTGAPSSGPGATSSVASGPGATGTVAGGAAPSASASASLPPGGNGGKTDVGVTGNTVTLATVADVTGVQPGIFRSAWQAMTALNAYVNSTGGIYGRQLKTLLLDSRADSVANRAAVTQACEQSFAMVGSMSAFDDGGASVGEKCGIPDISAITVNAARQTATNVYAASPNRPDYVNTSWMRYIQRLHPAEAKHSAMLWLNAGATSQNAAQDVKAMSALGYTFVYKTEVQVLEGNYSPYVQAMKEKGVQLVTMVADYQSIQRIQKSMEQAGWFPKVRLWNSVIYSQNYITTGGTAVNGGIVFLNTAMFEEAANNPEMQLYEQWLQRTSPGAVPDYFGMYAWSAGRLFQKAAIAAGPKLTRAALFAAIKQIHAWSDYGMHATHDIGNKLEANCTLFAEVRNRHFVRTFPSNGWNCEGSLMKT